VTEDKERDRKLAEMEAIGETYLKGRSRGEVDSSRLFSDARKLESIEKMEIVLESLSDSPSEIVGELIRDFKRELDKYRSGTEKEIIESLLESLARGEKTRAKEIMVEAKKLILLSLMYDAMGAV
jgi:hypothetical protein